MEYTVCTANDGCPLAFQSSRSIPSIQAKTVQQGSPAAATPRTTCILLLHGFSGSSEYFTRNFEGLKAHHWVVAPDMRGHGKSGRTTGGYHVSRLAADLRDLVAFLRTTAAGPETPAREIDFFPVGCSIGAAVLWTYVELFGCADFRGFVFVDQAPLQDRSPFGDWDAAKAHLGCYDEASMQAAQRAWIERPTETHRGLVQECLGYRNAPRSEDNVSEQEKQSDEAFFTKISEQCDQQWLARLLSDHTRYDHREAIEAITVPTLVMAGRRTGCFPLDGMKETVRRINKTNSVLATWSEFDSGHWLFYEEPERFNSEILNFVYTCGKALGISSST